MSYSVHVGQDGVGCWAWLVLDDYGRLVESAWGYPTETSARKSAHQALDRAHFTAGVQRRERKRVAAGRA